MNFFQRFIKIFSYWLLGALIVIIGLYQLRIISKSMFVIIILSKLINTVNFIAGMYLNAKGLRKSNEKFMIYVMGGMVARLFIMLAVILLVQYGLNLNFYSFIFVFFGFYYLLLTIEVIYLLKFEKAKS